jgi:hypothetical protein
LGTTLKIKQPESDNALQSIVHHLDEAGYDLRNCAKQGHEVTSVVYISSLLIMPNVVYNGVNLVDRIKYLANLTPNCICLIRTTTPEYFRGKMRLLQKAALNSLRTNCYVVVFSPYREFLNHAKFLLHYNFCLSEQVVHYGNFFGSTNLTGVGLGNPNPRKLGNFEEFAENRDLVKKAYKTSAYDRAYLKEILYMINYKAWLYTDSQYLIDHVSKHLKFLEDEINQSKITFGNSKMGACQKYLIATTSYNQTLAMLDDLPGKRLTERIIEKLVSKYPPESPFEIEAMSGSQNPDSLNDLGLSENSLEEVTDMSKHAIELATTLIKDTYQPVIRNTSQYFDQIEQKFFVDLKENHRKRAESLDIIIEPDKYR